MNLSNLIAASIEQQDAFQKISRARLLSELQLSRTPSYEAQRTGKLIPPIEPSFGNNYWFKYEIDLYKTSAALGVHADELTRELLVVRENIDSWLNHINRPSVVKGGQSDA